MQGEGGGALPLTSMGAGPAGRQVAMGKAPQSRAACALARGSLGRVPGGAWPAPHDGRGGIGL